MDVLVRQHEHPNEDIELTVRVFEFRGVVFVQQGGDHSHSVVMDAQHARRVAREILRGARAADRNFELGWL